MKRKLNKWLSGVLAACVLFTTVPVYAINDVSGTETSTEVVETSEETQSSEIETSNIEETNQESSEEQISEIADEMLNISPTDLGDEEEPSTDNWELGLVFYDSTVDNGKTPLTSIDWDASDGSYKEGTPRVITVQINYKNTNAVTTYQPGDLEISIPNLGYSNSRISGTAYDAQWSTKIIVGANDSTHTGYAWDFTTGNSPTTSQKTFTFTNTNTIEENANFEGSIQILYTLTPSKELPEPYDNECTHSYQKNLIASLNDLTKSNEISFIYNRTYIHIYEKKIYTLDKKASKIKGLDGLGENAQNYIWVYYEFLYSQTYPELSISAQTFYIRDSFPDGCIVMDEDKNQILSSNGTYKITSQMFEEGRTNVIGCIVGYPKAIFNDENQNLNITNTADLYGTYKNEQTESCLATGTVSINLAEFDFIYEGDLYGINKKKGSGTLRYQDIIKDTGDYNISRWELYPTVYYRGEQMTLKLGDDLLYDSDYNRLNDTDYYFSSISFRNPVNEYGKSITPEKYDCELWVRYTNNEEYTKIETFKNHGKTWTFNETDGVVGYYFIIKNLEESIVCDGFNYFPANIRFIKKDVPQNGTLYNFCYLLVYTKDADGNWILRNEPERNSYKGTLAQKIADYDLEKFGHYIQRAYASSSWSYYNVSQQATLSSYKKTYTDFSQNEKDEIVNGKYSIGATISTPFFQKNYADQYDPQKAIKGFSIYDLLPKGVELNSTEEEIKNSISLFAFDEYSTSPNYFDFFKADGKFIEMTSDEFKQMLKEHTNVSIKKNWNNTGRTKVQINIDLRNSPIYIFTHNGYARFDLAITYGINYSISYDSLIENGKTYMNYNYVEFINKNDIQRYTQTIMDDGSLDNDAKDINENGINDELLSYASVSTTVPFVISTHQDVQTQVQSTLSNYSTGIVDAEYGKNYSYKLRVRSGENDVTNLVIYDNLEKWVKDQNGNFVEAAGKKQYWQGEFLGIDTSYAESKGYTVKVYYSENEKAGTLTEDTSWKEYSDTVDKTKVKSLAFQYLDSEGNPAILPANSLTYVEINMKAPADEKITTLAYNGCWTQWNALDDFGQPVDFITGINSNIVKVALPNSIIDDELPTVTLKFIKEISGTDSDFENMLLDKAEERNFKITLTSLTANEDGSYNQITGLLSSTQGLTLSKVPIGTYLITESDDIYFDFVEMVPNNDEELIIDGVTLEKTDKGYVLTISDDLSGDVEFNIKVTNKIEPDRPYEDKEEIENLFKIPSVDA